MYVIFCFCLFGFKSFWWNLVLFRNIWFYFLGIEFWFYDSSLFDGVLYMFFIYFVFIYKKVGLGILII